MAMEVTCVDSSNKGSQHNQNEFSQIVQRRCACRAFLKDPVPQDLMRAVLEDARFSPSSCNTQPWNVHVVSGSKLVELSKLLREKFAAGEMSSDFSFDLDAFTGVYRHRLDENLNSIHQTEGGEESASVRNLQFFGAPHVCFFLMPSIGDNVRVAGDIGMYAQTFWLSLTAHGLGGVAQTMLAYFADTIREFLGIDSKYRLLFGMSFGYPDLSASINKLKTGRAPLEESVTFHW